MALRRTRRMVARATAATLLISAVVVGTAVSAPGALAAAGTVLFNQTFHDNTVDGTAGSVSLPTAPAASGNTACLTAAGNATANPLATCPTATDAQGAGKLRLTQNIANQEGGVFASTSVPTSQGLDVTFNSYQYGGTQGADGLAFVLAAVNPANPVTPAAIGQSGGALGYSAPSSNTPGLSYGYLGVGFDVYGNFSNRYEGLGCTDPANMNGAMPGEVAIRGPGNGNTGYCALASSAATATSKQLTLRASTRTGSVVPVEVVYNPSSVSVTTPSGLVVPAGDYDVHFTPVTGPAKDLVGALPTVPSGLYPASWVNASGYPKQLAFGWVGSTGSVTDYHEIDDVVVTTLNPVPQLAVAQTSYAAAALAPGSPVTYAVASSSSGAAENQPVTVTETLPTGVLPVGASGTGWVCAAPSGQQISCTSSVSPFTSGTITVNGVVTSSSVTQALVQSGTSAVASSSDASPATSSSAPAGTVPAAPTITAISPTNGAAGGGNDVKITGTGLGAATAIEIGTAAQFTAGTPTTVNLCAASGPGCFTVVSSTSLDISALPAHTAAAVTVKVVTLGTSASTAYTYNAGPALLFPAPPSGEVGVTYSDQLAVTGGTSPFTWSVSSGSLPPGVTLGASTGLLSGTPTTAGSYPFTVGVTDSSGLTGTEAATVTIIPGPSLSLPAPPAGWTHTVYSDTLTESGGTSPFTWSVSSGSLPAGISLSADGNLTGTPTATGTVSFTVKVTDANSQSATQAISITISAGVSTTFTAPPTAVVNTAYSDTLTATGGTAPYTWSVNTGTLPAGLTLSAAGVLAGTPTATGSSTFTVNVIDTNNGIATTSITLVVTASVTLTFPAPPSGVVGTAYTDTLTAAGGTTPYTFSISAGTLPAGLTLNASTGVVSGTPTTAGTSSFTVKVTDAKSTTATFATSIAILTSMLTVAVTTSAATTAPGGTESYTITATNSGQIALTGATFTDSLSDVLDDASYNGDAAATAGSVLFSSPNLTWTGTLAVGAAATITFSVTVNNPDTGNKTLTSTVTSTTASSNCASGSIDARCSSTVRVSVLTIAMTASTGSTTPGSVVSYTVTVTNSGTVAFTGAALTDSLSGVLDDASYNSDGATTAGSLTFASPNLTWTGNLAVGAAATITFSVIVNTPDTGNKILASAITSATAGSNCTSGSTDARCATSVTVLVPGLTMVVSAGTSTATPGSVVRYTVTVTNTGQTPYTGASFTDPLSGVLDDASYNGDAAATAGSVTFASPNLTWTGNLAVNAAATITFSVTVNNPDTGDKVVAITVTSATAGSNCASGSTDARCTTSVTVLVPGLTMVVSAGASTATPGSVVHYTVTVTNTGQTPYTGASFTDPLSGVLDDASYNSDAAATAGSVTFASPNLTWTGNLAVNAAATITFSVTVNNPDTGDKVVANTVTSATAGSNCASGSTDARCTTTVTVLVPGLEIAVSAGPAATTPGSVVHYTVTVTNTGQTPYTGAAFTDPLAGVLDDAAYDNDAAATAGTVSFARPNLSWSGNLAVGAAATITFSVTVNNPDTGNQILASTITSATPGSNCAVGSGDLPCTATVNVAVLTITNNSNVTTVTPGGVVRFTSVFTNSGQVPYTGITVASNIADVLDDATPNGDQTATSGTLVLTSTGISWTGSIPVGGTVTVTGTVTVNNPDTGNKVMASTLTTTAAGSNCPSGGTDPRCSVSVTVLVPALTIVSTANAPAAVSGQPVTFTVTVTNTGQTPYSGTVVTDSLNGALDDAAYNGDAAATTGSVSYAAPVLTWTGNLAVGASAVITYTMTVSSPDTGDKVIINTATSAATGSACPPGATAAPCRVTVAVLTPGLAIVVAAGSGTTTPGAVVHYTVTVTNTGQTPYTGAAFTDPLSGVLDDASYNSDAAATAGSVTFASPNLSWSGNLAVGAVATITFSVTVSNPDGGNKILASTITSATPGSNCAAGNADLRCTATVPVAVLMITASSSVSTVTPSGVVRFTTVFVNSGQVPYTGITIASNITDVRDDATPNGDQTATSGTLTLTATGISWTGNIPVGGTVTITGTVTVNNPDTGNKVLTNNFSTAAAGSDCPSGGTDPRCSVSVAVLIPALTIVKSADVSTTSPGGVIHYTVTVTDSGQTPYTGATYTDQLDGVLGDAAYNGDAAATVGSVSFASPDLTWTGNLTAGATATITYSVTVNNPDTGNRILTNTVVSSTPGTDCPVGGADPRCTVTVDDLVPGLDIVASADTPTATPGTVVHYTITATNTGQAAYTGASFTDPLSGVLDDAAYNGDAAATAGSVTFASPNLNWTGNLAVGAVATITFSVTVNNPDTGNGTLASTITSATVGNNCPVSGGTDPSCAVTVTAVNETTLTFTATADTAAAAAGDVVRVTITVANSGLTPYNGATFTAGLGGVPGNATYDGDAAATSGSLTVTNPSLAWTGNVPASGTVTITYSVTVNSPDTGNDILTSIITSTSAESDCGAGSADPRCTATVDVAALAITATTDAATTSPGSDVTYTVTAVNTGQAAYSDTSITLDFSDVFEDATYNGDLAATSGTLTTDATAGTGTWTGDLAPGATVTITFSVTIIPPDSDLNDRVPTLTVDSAALGNNCPAGGTDPGCSAGVTVLVPALTITKTANTTAAVPGATVTYTITIADTGDTPYTGATVTDTLTGVLGDATYNNDAAAASGTLSYASSTLNWTGNLTVGATVTITYSVTVRNPDRGGKLMVNIVTSTATGSTCPPGTTSPGCTLTIPVLTPTLTIVKTASAATATPGQKVTYTITVTDTGQTSYTGAVVTDALTGVLDDAAYDTDAAASTGTVSYASPVLTWTGNLTVGAVATITYSVIVNNPDTGDKILTDTVISAASGSNCRSGSTDPRCASTVTVSQLIINSTADVTTTTPGGVVHYTTTLTNTGQTPYYGITMSSDGAGLADDAVSNGDETATSGTFSLGTTGAVWTGDLPVGGTVTLTGSVTVDNPDTGDHIMTETNTSDAPGSNCPTGSTGPPCSTTITVLTPALTITTTANTPAAVPGQQVTFTVTLTDTGQTSYTGAVVTDDLTGALNDAAYDGDAAATTGSVGYTAPVLTWTGNLAVGGTAVITYSVTVHNPDNGDKTVSAAVASSAAGSTCPPASANLGCGLTVPVLTPALTIVKTASAATATPGQKVSYTITVTDTGQTSYTGAVVTDALTGVLDDAAYDSDAAASTGTTSYASPVLTWTGNLTPGQAATITYSVTVSNPDTGDKVLTGNLTTAASGANCAAGSTDPRCTATVDVAVLAITNTANVSTTTPGSSVAYTITIANTGQVFYDGATVTDPLSAVTDDAAFDNDAATTAGSITYTAPNLTWTGDLVPGASATITFTVTVSNPDTGDKILASTLTSASPGSTCPAAGPAPACTATVTDLIPALAITKTAATTTTTPGSAVGYTITITDTGQTPYTGVTVTDDLTGLVSDAAYDNDAAATAGTVTYTTPVLTWTGNLAPGGTAAITYTVTTASPDTGDKHLVNTVASTAPGSTCPPGNTNPACTATVTDLIPALTITKTATVAATTPGSAVGFTITVADTGQTPYTAATVTDSLSGDLADAAYNNDAAATTGTVTYTTPVLTWTGNLTPGNTATITYSVTVNNPDTGGGALSNTVVSTATGSTCPSGGTGSGCSVTVAVVAGPLTMTAPATASLGSAAPGGTLSAGLGTVQVTDDRGFGAGWTATVSATSFATGAGTPAETIPAADAQYNISGLGMTTGSATFTPVPTTRLSARPKAVVNATNVAGNTTVTWDPTIVVTIPGSAVGGSYAATIIHSVS